MNFRYQLVTILFALLLFSFFTMNFISMTGQLIGTNIEIDEEIGGIEWHSMGNLSYTYSIQEKETKILARQENTYKLYKIDPELQELTLNTKSETNVLDLDNLERCPNVLSTKNIPVCGQPGQSKGGRFGKSGSIFALS